MTKHFAMKKLIHQIFTQLSLYVYSIKQRFIKITTSKNKNKITTN